MVILLPLAPRRGLVLVGLLLAVLGLGVLGPILSLSGVPVLAVLAGVSVFVLGGVPVHVLVLVHVLCVRVPGGRLFLAAPDLLLGAGAAVLELVVLPLVGRVVGVLALPVGGPLLTAVFVVGLSAAVLGLRGVVGLEVGLAAKVGGGFAVEDCVEGLVNWVVPEGEVLGGVGGQLGL